MGWGHAGVAPGGGGGGGGVSWHRCQRLHPVVHQLFSSYTEIDDCQSGR